jgi:hypothetical protein
MYNNISSTVQAKPTNQQQFGLPNQLQFNPFIPQLSSAQSQSPFNPFSTNTPQFNNTTGTTGTNYDIFRNPNVATLSVFDRPDANFIPPTR